MSHMLALLLLMQGARSERLFSGVTRKYPVTDVIYRIERWRYALYLTTCIYIYILKGDRLTRHRVEPDINGKLILFSEQL